VLAGHAASRGVVLAADRRSRPCPPDLADPRGDDEEPARARSAVLGAGWRADVRLSGPPGHHQPGRGPLFLSESSRNHAQPLSLWTWSKVVRRIAVTAGVERFSTHTTRHLCLTDLARMGWELHAIACFAGHHHTRLHASVHPPVRPESRREARPRHGTHHLPQPRIGRAQPSHLIRVRRRIGHKTTNDMVTADGT
jgi:integrase